MLSYRLLADENIAPAVVAALRELGADVRTVAELGLLGAGDTALIEAARREERVILTHDPDLARLALADPEPPLGVVSLRPGHRSAPSVLAMLEALASSELELVAPFVATVTLRRDRISLRVRRVSHQPED